MFLARCRSEQDGGKNDSLHAATPGKKMCPGPYFLRMVSMIIPAANAEIESTMPNPGAVVVGITEGVSVTGGVAGDSVADVVVVGTEV